MFTVCPKCTLTLSVTAGDLRTGQGYVRCGRCSNVFNALLTLTEQPPEAGSAQSPSPSLPPTPAPATPGTQNVKAAAAPAAEPNAPNDVASSVQIDQILMLGGSAFPRPQAASSQRPATPSPQQRRTTPTPPKAPPRAPPASSSAAAPRANSTPAAPAPAPRAGPVPPQTSARPSTPASREQPQIKNEKLIGQSEQPRGGRENPAAGAAKPVRPATAAATAPKRPQPAARTTEEPMSTADEAELIERSGSEEFEGRTVETIVLEGDGFTQTEEFVSEDQSGLAALRREIESLSDEAGPAASTDERTATPGGSGRKAHSFRLPRRGSAAADAAEVEPDERPDAGSSEAVSETWFAFDTQSLPHRWAWLSGSIALALLLGIQAIDHWRDALAASPNLGSMVTHAYAAVGVTLQPRWDLAAYEVRQQGAESDPKDAHVIHVRLSLANHAARAQPVPVLRLTLLDRYGKRIARRDLAPDEYWPRGHVRQSFLRADQRIDSEVAVRDPNADSASFELDVCLRGQERLRCAMDSAPATANLLTP